MPTSLEDLRQSLPRTGVLYQNVERDVTLIDIPESIAAAQGRSDILLSTPPLETPISLNEEYQPKTEKAKAKTAEYLTGVDKHAEYKPCIERALSEICNHVSGSWCMPRKLMTQIPKSGNSDMELDDPEKDLWARLKEWAALDESKGEEGTLDFEKMMASLSATSGPSATSVESVPSKWIVSYGPARDTTDGPQGIDIAAQGKPKEPLITSFHNAEHHALDVSVAENTPQSGHAQAEYSFRIPPRATFFLSDATHADTFRAAFRELTDEFTLPRHFDLVLLDPPWPNRSAKRKGTYDQVGGMPYLSRMLRNMDIDNYLEHNALVGIWITNKESLRDHVLGPDGLFESWNVGLIEEWIWIKTTTKGEPMFDLEGISRKPYEVLLLGRAAPNAWTRMSHAPVIKKRVIAAVPDVHSRKPCLKELLDPYMPDANDYSALEVFSRYLVAGWMSWGNEVLKFNWGKYWVSGFEEGSEFSLSR